MLLYPLRKHKNRKKQRILEKKEQIETTSKLVNFKTTTSINKFQIMSLNKQVGDIECLM